MNIYRDGALYLYGTVGTDWFEDGFNASDVVTALLRHGSSKDIDVHINSGGGIVSEGIAIHSLLASHKGKVTISIDGIAASSASVIAMSGDEIEMRLGSVMMIHDPAGYFLGYTEDDLDEAKAQLNTFATAISELYAAQTGMTAKKVRADMKATLWMTPDEAVEKGYATKSSNDNSITASAFDYRVYAKAPDRLVALATENNWSLRAAAPRADKPVASTPSTKEKPTMVDKKTAEQITAEQNAAIEAAKTETATAVKARIQAIMTSEEAKGRETQAEHFAYKTEMSAEDAIAALATAPKPAAPNGAETENVTITGEDSTHNNGAYAQQRVNASGLAQPNGANNTAKNTRDVLASAMTKTNARRA